MFHKMRCNFSELTPAVALVKVEGLILYDGPSIQANWPALITGHGHATLAHQFIYVNGRSQIETNNGLTIQHTMILPFNSGLSTRQLQVMAISLAVTADVNMHMSYSASARACSQIRFNLNNRFIEP